MQNTPLSDRSAAELLAQAKAAEHAATAAMRSGDLERARTLALIGRLRVDLSYRQAALECPDCEGRGLVPAARRGDDWPTCPNVVAHPKSTCMCGGNQ
ncbi:hypothetical protein [Streptomyces sp. NPDC050988]|uniref:hypothetical protein n=1 Tax=Streptomyces sp. NPDC050988 TaxID=3365637 RepID=UPI003791A037